MSDPLVTNVTGLLDVDAIVKTLLKARQQKIQKLSQERGLISARITSLNNFLSSLRELETILNRLNTDALFKGKRVTSSDPSILTASAGENTPNISLNILVESLAQPEIRVTSGGLQSLSETLSSAQITLRYQKSETETETITISFGGGTLSDLAQTINNSQNLVKASVYFDGSRYRLLLAEKDVGASTAEENIIDIDLGALSDRFRTQSNPLTILLQSAKNSRIRIGSEDTEPIVSPTNTFREVLPGLQINVQKTSSNPITLTIENTYTQINTTIGDILNRINNTLGILEDLTKRGALFQGNAGLNSLKGLVLNALRPLQRLGIITTNQEGKYTLDASKLKDLLESGRLEEVRTALIEANRDLKNSISGFVNSVKNQIEVGNRKIKRINDQLETLQRQIKADEEKLRLTFTKIENALLRNENLRMRLESFVVSLSESRK